MREASENLHQRAAAIRLGLALDNVDPSSASDATKASLCQAIIAYRQSAKHLPAEKTEPRAQDCRVFEQPRQEIIRFPYTAGIAISAKT